MITFARFLSRLTLLALLPVSTASVLAQIAPTLEGDANRGAKLFRATCAGCHINKGTAGRGPNLTDIVGGTSTVLYNFKYSSTIVVTAWGWNVERLDRYLENPAAMFLGAPMASRVRNKKDRTDIIAYLKTLRTPEGTPPVRGRVKTGFEDR